jgi:flagellar motility protein MotE (MotC chaperone)
MIVLSHDYADFWHNPCVILYRILCPGESFMNIKNIKMREIVIVAFIMFIVFPIIYLGYLFINGKTRLNADHSRKNVKEIASIETPKQEVMADSLANLNTVAFQALQKERTGIEFERRKMMEDKQRMELYQQELEKQKDELKRERERIEGLVEKSDTFDKKKSIQISKAYSAMRPAEAAQIISTLSDEFAIRILDGITEDRIKAKIIAALPPEKATSITNAMVGKTKLQRN